MPSPRTVVTTSSRGLARHLAQQLNQGGAQQGTVLEQALTPQIGRYLGRFAGRQAGVEALGQDQAEVDRARLDGTKQGVGVGVCAQPQRIQLAGKRRDLGPTGVGDAEFGLAG